MKQESSTSVLNMILPKVVKDFSDFAGFQSGAEKLLSGDSESVSTANCDVLAQEIIGSAQKISCQLSPSMGKAWLSYASWCFTHANHSLSGIDSNVQNNVSSILQSELSPDRFHLTDNEKSEVEQTIRSFYVDKSADYADHSSPATKGYSYSSEQEYSMTTLIEHVTHLLETAAGAPGFEASDGEGAHALLSSELTVLFCKYDPAMGNAMPLISNLIEIWWSLRQRRVSLFGHAANAYFQYLSHSSTESQPSYHRDALKGKTRGYTLRALLYLLHIILNYGAELKQTLESGLSTVPLLPWQVNHDSGICSIFMLRLMYNYMF
jgi:PI-3-kinase-related kinase SMG-1